MPHEKKTILVVEDDQAIRELLERGLQEAGYLVKAAGNGEEGHAAFLEKEPDMAILDVMMPGMNGLQLCSKIREKSLLPIILLTALGTSENVVLGLDMGADDYVVKPFKFSELLARIRSLLRRTERLVPAAETALYTFEDLVVNDSEKTVTRNGKAIQLTSTEYRLLLAFIQQPRKVFSRNELLERVWGEDYTMGTNVVDVYVNYLRKKLDRPENSKLIHTLIGHGYVMREET